MVRTLPKLPNCHGPGNLLSLISKGLSKLLSKRKIRLCVLKTWQVEDLIVMAEQTASMPTIMGIFLAKAADLQFTRAVDRFLRPTMSAKMFAMIPSSNMFVEMPSFH